jgi:hypothetical protein
VSNADVGRWRKSSYSGAGGCVEMASWRTSRRSGGTNCLEAGSCSHGVAVRDSKDREGPLLIFSVSAWGELTARLRVRQA